MSDTVHVITTLGPGDTPALVVPAEFVQVATVGGWRLWLGEPKPSAVDVDLSAFRIPTPEDE